MVEKQERPADRTFVKKYDQNVKVAKACGRSTHKNITFFSAYDGVSVARVLSQRIIISKNLYNIIPYYKY